MKEKFSIRGNVLIEVCNAVTGHVEHAVHCTNAVPTAGANAFRDAMGGFALFPAGIGGGTSNTAFADSDIALGNEVIRKPISRRIRPRDGAIRFQAFVLETEGNNNTLAEAGLFNSSTLKSGQLMARFTHPTILKTSSVFLTYTWEWEFLVNL